jgi:hypothetical protein
MKPLKRALAQRPWVADRLKGRRMYVANPLARMIGLEVARASSPASASGQ